MRRLSSGDEQAFNELFRACWDQVYSTALLISKSPGFAEDAAQEVFLWVWKERSQLKDVQNIEAYLGVATRNFILRKLRRLDLEQRYRQSLLHQKHEPATTEASLHVKHLEQLLQKGINLLPPQQQRAFKLSREGGMSHEDISRAMNLSVNSVKDYIVKALAFLRKYLAQHGGMYCSASFVAGWLV